MNKRNNKLKISKVSKKPQLLCCTHVWDIFQKIRARNAQNLQEIIQPVKLRNSFFLRSYFKLFSHNKQKYFFSQSMMRNPEKKISKKHHEKNIWEFIRQFFFDAFPAMLSTMIYAILRDVCHLCGELQGNLVCFNKKIHKPKQNSNH